MNFLDKTGVGLLWSICKTKFALKNHSHNYLPLSGGTLTGDLLFSDSGTTFRQIKGTCGGDDFWRIGGGATAESAGFMEIATADNATEPIYVRQYIGVFATIKRTATLLDANGNTSFPGIVAAAKFKGALEGNASTASNASKVNGHTVNADVPSGAKFTDTNTWRGIQNNLTSNSTSDSLSAAQGKVLKGLIDSKANSSDLSSYAQKSQAITSIDISLIGDTKNGYTQSILPKYANNILGVETIIKNASVDTDGFMSRKDKSKLDGIQAGANKYTLHVASATTLGGIKVATNKSGGAFPICVNNDGLACTKINGIETNSEGSVGSVFTANSNNNTFANYSTTEIHVGVDENDFHVGFPSKTGTLALTSDCLSSEKGSVYPGSANGFSINFTSAQQIVLLDTSGNYNISDWYNQSSIGNVLDMYPCGLMGGKLSSEHKDLLKVMEITQGGPKLTSIDSFELQYNIHVRLIHIDNGVLVCPYTLNY